MAHRIYTTSVSSVYPHYVAKVERKGRTKAELDEVIEWLTGYDAATLQKHLDAGATFEAFFDGARASTVRREFAPVPGTSFVRSDDARR